MAEVAQAKVNAEPDGSNDETDKSDDTNSQPFHNQLTGQDSLSEHFDRNMDVESPSSELENLASPQYEESDSGESMSSGKHGMYEVNPDTDAGTDVDAVSQHDGDNKENLCVTPDRKDNRGSVEPAEKKLKTDKGLPDVGGKLTDSRPASVASSGGKSSTPGRDKDPAKKEKDKDREDRIKQAQIRLAEERQRKIEEMREQQRMAQENREKQLEARRKKIEELKRREEERRKQVEERRRTQDEVDRAKKEAILNKAKERLTRYEQWKAHGRKGYPGESPPSKQLSMSMSVLYQKKNSDFSSTGSINKVGTSNLKSGAESMMALNTIPENRSRRSLPASMPPTRHKSAVNIAGTGVKMRDPSKMSPRKQRPYSVATSMPSFVPMESEGTSRPSRSKSTDRAIRDASKTRTPGRKEDDKTDGKEKKAATLPRPYDRKKIEERRLEAEKKREERKEREKEREKERMERMSKSETHEKEKHPTPKPLSKSFIERMSTPKQSSAEKKETGEKDSTPVKTTTQTQKIKAKPQRDTPTKSPSKSSLKDTSKNKEDSVSPKSLSPVPTKTVTPTIQVDEPAEGENQEASDKPESATSDMPATEPTVKFAEPEVPKASPKPKTEPKQVSPEPKSQKSDTSTPKTDKEREMEEYKNKLAEKRRLAREKAEREAEIERIKQEELKRQEEERQREEEERQRREEEEILRLAEENRKAEEERLAKAIEAEEKRKREEAERLEQERIQREEAEKKAKEEAERLEKERQEKARKEEEEKIERKKRLESVMKRFKPDSPASTPEKTRTESPPRTTTASSSGRASLVSSEDEKGDDSEKEEKPTEKLEVADEPPKFKSPLLQNLTKVKPQEGDAGTPKFKSPLLQSIMAKTKLGARLSSSKLDELGKSNENLTTSTDTLPDDSNDSNDDETKTSADNEQTVSMTDSVVNGHGGHSEGVTIAPECDIDNINKDIVDTNNSNIVQVEVKSEQVIDKPVDNGYTPAEVGGELDSVIQNVDTQDSRVSEGISDEKRVSDSQSTAADSAVSLSFNGVSNHNGDLHIDTKELIESKELVDSSISMRTADSFASSETGSIGGSLADSQNLPASDSTQFEEVIDLNVHVTNKTLKAQQLAENLLNFNLNDNDDITMSGTSETPKPIIAFEDNATRRQDVPDLLS